MNIEKINNIDYFYLENKKYKTNTITVCFKEEVKKEDVVKRQILPKFLLEKTMNYPSRLKLARKASSLYSCSTSIKENVYTNYSILQFSITYIRSKYLEEDITKDIIDFLYEIIYNPYTVNGEFDNDSFKRIKNELKNNIKRKDATPQTVAKEQAVELLYKDQVCTYRHLTNKKVDGINNAEVYKYYQELIKNNEMAIFFEGDESIKDKLNIFKSNVENKYDYKPSRLTSKEMGLVVKKHQTKQNNLFFIYDNFNLSDKYNVRNFLLGMMLGEGATSLLFQEVREKNSLAYSIGSLFDPNYKLLYIYGGVKLDSLDKTIEIINEQFNRLKNDDLSELLNDSKQSYLNTVVSSLDTKGFLTLRAMRGWLNNEYTTIEELMDKIKNTTLEEIQEVAKKIECKLMYALQGDLKDETN